MNAQEKISHAKQALYRAAHFVSIGENDPRKIEKAYQLIFDAIDLISETEKESAA